MLVRSDARKIPITNDTVQCVVTSPPYWGLRQYVGEQQLDWDGWRGAFGLEPTIEMYVEHSVEILREIRRVLRPDGVCFYNLGDSYSAQPGQRKDTDKAGAKQQTVRASTGCPSRAANGLKPKDLCLIPARVAIAAQADGWWVRSDIIWAKPNPMPESVTDRPTDAYEHIFMLTKSARYYWDAEAVKESVCDSQVGRIRSDIIGGSSHVERGQHSKGGVYETGRRGNDNRQEKNACEITGRNRWWVGTQQAGAGIPLLESGRNRDLAPKIKGDETGLNRNLRNFWTFATAPYRGAHFATFPPELVIRCLLAATKQRDWVLDPFGGSGTVGEVAFNMGRRFVLCDLAYQDLQRERIPPMAGLLSWA